MRQPISDPVVLNRMRTAFDLYEAAEQMMRQNLRRRFPHASEVEIERRLIARFGIAEAEKELETARRKRKRFELEGA